MRPYVNTLARPIIELHISAKELTNFAGQGYAEGHSSSTINYVGFGADFNKEGTVQLGIALPGIERWGIEYCRC